MENENKNYYEVLEIPFNATQEDINNGFIRARNAYSGNSIALYSLLSADECQAQLELIEEAYSILSDPEKRREYNRIRGFDKISKEQNEIEKQRMQNENVFTPQYEGTERRTSSERRSGEERRKPEGPKGDMYNKFPDDFSINKKDVVVSSLAASNKYALDYQVDPELEQKIETTTEFSGEFLKQIREYKNVSLERMADMTKISKSYIRQLEDDNFEKLPAMVYVRGFVMQYAKILKLNAELVATSYIHNLKQIKEGND